MIELLGDLFEWIVGLFEDPPFPIPDPEEIVGVIGTALLIQGAIYVASLTADSIRSELSNRRELKNKGVTNVIIQDFIEKNGYTEISLAALNAQNQQVGTVNVASRNSDHSSLKIGQKIQI